MLYLLRKSAFDAETNAAPGAAHTKHYQHIEIERVLAPYFEHPKLRVAEIGPHRRFDVLKLFASPRRAIIDPYDSAEGAGLPNVPDNLPYPLALYRCLLGEDSAIIPSKAFDLSFSTSVIEHIGQREANYDCNPTDRPPKAQERARRKFCKELFRITKPGGLTIHAVDHAARNLSFVNNFRDAGFLPLDPTQKVSVEDCLDDPDAVRQKLVWHDFSIEMSVADQRLSSVLVMGFLRP